MYEWILEADLVRLQRQLYEETDKEKRQQLAWLIQDKEQRLAKSGLELCSENRPSSGYSVRDAASIAKTSEARKIAGVRSPSTN